jgi:hypothetical protein
MRRRVSSILAAPIAAALVLAACSTDSTGPTGTPAGGGRGGAATGGATQPPGGNGGNGDITGLQACSMLTPEEIQSALGVAMKAGVEQDTDTQVECDWNSQDDSVGVSVSVAQYDDELWKTFSSAENAKPVSGLGEAAFSGYPHAGDLSIKQSGYEIDLGIVDFSSSEAKIDAADMTLAGLVLSRL